MSTCRIATILATFAAIAALTGCNDPLVPDAAREAETQESAAHETAELAEPMARLQYYSQKLGYAIDAENEPLAGFYIHEMEELSASIMAEIPEYEGHAISDLTRQMMMPALDAQHQAIESGQWSTARDVYRRVIDSCNACHIVTQHGFIVITPASGEPPFNQRFTESDDQ